jgi:lipopolysaccharide transport system permease protein
MNVVDAEGRLTPGLAPQRKPFVTIRPPSRWVPINLREMWHFHDLLTTFAIRDVKLRYRQTLLGVAWVILQPLAGAGILSVVFGQVANLPSDGVPYFLFSYVGFLAWNVFSSTLTKSSASLLASSPLISKIYFPRLILPLSVTFSTVLDFVVAAVMGAVLLAWNGITPGAGILLMPVIFVLLLLRALGAGLIAAALNVSYRDIGYMLPVAVQLLLFASPVAYSVSAVPQNLQKWYLLNPLSGLLEAFRWSVLGVGDLRVGALVYSAIVSVALFIVGGSSFRSLERKFADVI